MTTPILDPDFLSDDVFDSILEQLTPLPAGTTLYSAFAQLTEREALNHYLNHHGIIGYTNQILSAINSIKSATIIQ